MRTLFLCAWALLGQEAVDGKRALESVRYLASDEFGGRKSGLASGAKAELWMAAAAAAAGLEVDFHAFKGSVTEEGGEAVFEASGGSTEATRKNGYLSDYVTLIYSGRGKVHADVVFAGYGTPADYDGVDVKGKIVLAVRGLSDRAESSAEQRYIGYKSSLAHAQGAIGFLLVEGDKAVPGTIQEKYHREHLPAVWIGREAADDLFARAGKGLLAAQVEALKKGERRTFPLEGVRVKLEIDSRLLRDRPMRNVLGYWRGTGDEYVVCGAHLDHVGTDAAGNVYNGADDNGSGSSTLLEVARAIATTGKRFKRTIVFVWFAAEEQGLTGSWTFVKVPPVPLDKVAVMFNMDMVGQGKNVMSIGGTEVYPREAKWLGDLEAPGILIERFRSSSNSDHYPFQTNGVPAFFMHTKGPHPNYHKPEDDVVRIRPELLETAGNYMRALAERAADADHPFTRRERGDDYLWHNATTVDLHSNSLPPTEAGIDFRVQWYETLDELYGHMTRLLTSKAERLYRPGDNVNGLANDLKPTLILGIRGRVARTQFVAARHLGATLYAPFTGEGATTEAKDIEALKKFAKRRSIIISLDGAPELMDIKSPILVKGSEWAAKLQRRIHPWVAYVEMKPALDITQTRKMLGQGHIVLVPSDPALTEVHAAIAGNLKRQKHAQAAISGLLGGNFIRLLRKLDR